jgi:tRNA 2-thiouridine synthesizing protein B
MLHILNKSPYETTTLQLCLNSTSPGDSIILIEDGVYVAVANTPYCNFLQKKLPKIAVHALLPDVLARGIHSKIAANVAIIDFDTFVALTLQYHPIHTWG